MSADNSPESASIQRRSREQAPKPDNRASRYNRAAEAAMAQTPELRQADDRRQGAVERQAREDRRERGRSKIMNDVAALLGDDTKPGRPTTPQADDPAQQRTPSRAKDADEPGRSNGDPGDRPGLELDEPDEDSAKSKKRGKKTVQDFAAEHELNAKDLYGLEVSFEEGGPEPVSIGTLKDAWKDRHDLGVERDQFEDWRTSSQNEILQARSELELTVQALAEEIPPAAMAKATQRATAALAAQVEKSRGQLAEWFPEWKDVQVKIRDRDAFTKLMATYGFQASEVHGVLDARLIKFGMDAMRLMDRYKRLREGERERKPSGEPPARGKPKAAATSTKDRAEKIAKGGDKIGAVATLLGG